MILVKFKRSKNDSFLLKKFNCSELLFYEDIIFDQNFYKLTGSELSKLDIHTSKIYNKIFANLIFKINRYLNTKISKKSFEYLIGYWAIHFIQQSYYKHIIISKIVNRYKKCKFLINKNPNFYCNSSLDYFNLILNDDYQTTFTLKL